MTRILHIMTRSDDSLAQTVIKAQQSTESVEVVDLSVPEPDYDKLLDKIFESDSIQVW